MRHTNYANRANQLLERAEQRDARAKELETELADVRQRLATRDQHEQAIRKRMLEP